MHAPGRARRLVNSPANNMMRRAVGIDDGSLRSVDRKFIEPLS
jgi:hypothetical protein